MNFRIKKMNQLSNENKILENRVSELESQICEISKLNSQTNVGEIDFLEILLAIWLKKWLLLNISFIFLVGAAALAFLLPNEYRSTAILAPASSSNGSSLANLAGQFGGLASIAGVDISGFSGEDKSAIALEVVKTWGFIERFIEKEGIKAEVFAAKGWSRKNNQIIYDSDLYDVKNKRWVRDYEPEKGEKAEPSSWELYEEFMDILVVNQDSSSGLIYLSIDHYSPHLAREWVEKLVKLINGSMQQKDKIEILKRISYLEKQIKNTNVAEMRTVFYQLIEDQTQNLMLAEASEEYVFKVVSEPKVAEEEIKPKRIFIVLFGAFLGAALAVCIILIYYFKQKQNLKDKS